MALLQNSAVSLDVACPSCDLYLFHHISFPVFLIVLFICDLMVSAESFVWQCCLLYHSVPSFFFLDAPVRVQSAAWFLAGEVFFGHVMFLCYDGCYHCSSTGKQLQLLLLNLQYYSDHAVKFARWQHPAVGHGFVLLQLLLLLWMFCVHRL